MPTDILITGICTVDAIARTVDAFPSPGGLRFFDRLTLTTGGCAVNCSIALARLGIPCDVATRIGSDAHGNLVARELERSGLSTRLVSRDPDRSTSFSFVAVHGSGERSFLHTTGANATLSRSHVPAAALVARRFVFVTGAMLMDTLDGDETAALLRDARAAGAATLLDTVFVEGVPSSEWRRRILPALPHTDYFIPSLPEASAIAGLDQPDQMARYFEDAGARHIAIKLAERGVFLGGAALRAGTVIPAFTVPRTVDATGAGDCWAAGFIAALYGGLAMPEAARLGNAVAAFSIQSPGATSGVPSLAEVRAFMTSSRT